MKQRHRPVNTTRDLGLHGAGKGDTPRSCFSVEFRDNFSRIQFTGVEGFERKGRRLVKHYRIIA